MAPPALTLQASAADTETATNGYQPHENDPKPFSSIPGMVEYGAALEGPLFHQGESDQNAISANDVNQGYIGNCYMVAALASLASQSPEIIRNAISGPKADGTYDVTLYENFGPRNEAPLTPKTINISSSFVTNAAYDMGGGNIWDEAGNVTYAGRADVDQEGNQELWVRLIEKAWAAEMGGFEETDGGWPLYVFEALTGEEYTEYHFNGLPDYAGNADFQEVSQDYVIGVMDTDWIRDTIIGFLEDGKGVACTQPGHSETVLRADHESVTIRDPQWMDNGKEEEVVMTWEEFRAKYVKFTSVMPNN